jgi:ComF family protein
MLRLKEIKESLFHLAFPHVCTGCGSDLLSQQTMLCMHCITAMPDTNFHLHAANVVEKKFWGRLNLKAATAQYYFTKESLMQHLMHQLKYKGNKSLGIFLGRMMAESIINSDRFADVDALIPLPLFKSKERKRGYNQATLLCEGMAEIMQVPVIKNAVGRNQHTETQTKKNRIERWQNIDGKFELQNQEMIAGKHLLLVDDVVTTGATLEACGQVLLQSSISNLSIATLCYAAK